MVLIMSSLVSPTLSPPIAIPSGAYADSVSADCCLRSG
jgi:hypothetical protein